MSASTSTRQNRAEITTDAAALAHDDCPDCGDDLPCFDHHEKPCPNGQYGCDGPRSEAPCRACRRAFLAGGAR